MGRILTILLLVLIGLYGISYAQFGSQPFGQNPFASTGAFGAGPFGSASMPTVIK